jgi:hypothetical protein
VDDPVCTDDDLVSVADCETLPVFRTICRAKCKHCPPPLQLAQPGNDTALVPSLVDASIETVRAPSIGTSGNTASIDTSDKSMAAEGQGGAAPTEATASTVHKLEAEVERLKQDVEELQRYLAELRNHAASSGDADVEGTLAESNSREVPEKLLQSVQKFLGALPSTMKSVADTSDIMGSVLAGSTVGEVRKQLELALGDSEEQLVKVKSVLVVASK